MTTNATNSNTTTTRTRTAELQRKVNEVAVTGAKSILGFAGGLAADGQLKIVIDVKLTVKATEDESRYRGDRTSHAVADVTPSMSTLTLTARSIAITGDGECHGQR